MKQASGISLFFKRGYWCIQYKDSQGVYKQKSTGCKRRPDALKILSQFDPTVPEEPKQKQLLFTSFTKDFLEYAKSNYSAGTVKIYSLTFKHFQRIVSDLDMNTITPRHWDLYKTARLKERYPLKRKIRDPKVAEIARSKQKVLSPVTVNLELRTLKSAFNTATRWQIIQSNPFEKLTLVSIPKRTPAFLTAEDAQNLLDAIPEVWFKNFIIFAINTGMRRGEILSLRWSDINTTARIACITNQEDFTTKSGEQRAISLNDAALMVLKRLPRSRRNEYVFTYKNGRRITPDIVTHRFKLAVRKAGLSEALHLHSTRHSFASLLVGSGTSLFTVSKLLGHSSTKTSEIYAHLLPQHLHHEVDKISIGLNSES